MLRRTAEPLTQSRAERFTSGALLAAALVGVSVLQAGDLTTGMIFSGAIAVVVMILGLVADRLSAALGRLGERQDRWVVRHALRALGRPGAGTMSAMVALALGVVVVLGTWLLQHRVTSQLTDAFPDTAPSAFLIDVQSDQWDQVEGVLDTMQADRVQSARMVMGRRHRRQSTESWLPTSPTRPAGRTREQRLGLRSGFIAQRDHAGRLGIAARRC